VSLGASGPVAVIPARGGSKGVPGKNLRKLGGIPLVARTIVAARASVRIERVYVSSDDEVILRTAAEYGAMPITRPRDLAHDKSASELALLHALSVIRDRGDSPEVLVFLQCTSPFTEASDIDRLVTALDEARYRAALTVSEDHSFLWTIDAKNEAQGVNHDPSQQRLMRQQLPRQYRENGAGYAMRVEAFERSHNRFCPPIALVTTSHPPLEIDTESDFEIAEAILDRSHTRATEQ